ncbi:H/ACA ribonucleoprotein complex subunit dkc1, variant 4 [Dermatophagoides farinae]|uniref:H/ACA ribonucleoprotein complex subunit dkc1, variant 4 n=1 Tax=Dermatophagoides farinae TaxID=6954 RepID=A0A922L5W0_DERFA|nr:H/ACA ribonucleoprotein complex subunit dkc1, variant 4 [Dermatophagoides farinae]
MNELSFAQHDDSSKSAVWIQMMKELNSNCLNNKKNEIFYMSTYSITMLSIGLFFRWKTRNSFPICYLAISTQSLYTITSTAFGAEHLRFIWTKFFI